MSTAPGADSTSTREDWNNEFSLVYTPKRLVIGAATVGAWGAVVQYGDGSIGPDGTEARPEIAVLGGDGQTRAQARELAMRILETVDLIDAWVAR